MPISAYHRDDQQHHLPEPIDASCFPDYLEALHSSRAIDATNAMRDPRTREMADNLRAKDIHAMLDASIRVDGQVVGVLCLEQGGSSRAWQADEIAFAGELADQFAQVINNHNRRTLAANCGWCSAGGPAAESALAGRAPAPDAAAVPVVRAG